jgi:hypothetical protein
VLCSKKQIRIKWKLVYSDCCTIDQIYLDGNNRMPKFFGGIRLFIFFSAMRLYVLGSGLCCPLRFSHENYVRFAFNASCL